MDEQLADEAFGERMQRLGNGLQNWVITNFRRVKIGKFSLFSALGFSVRFWRKLSGSATANVVFCVFIFASEVGH
jgi:hypothetical protein